MDFLFTLIFSIYVIGCVIGMAWPGFLLDMVDCWYDTHRTEEARRAIDNITLTEGITYLIKHKANVTRIVCLIGLLFGLLMADCVLTAKK